MGLSIRNHRSYDENTHAFEVLLTSSEYDCLITAEYVEEYKPRGTMTSHLDCPHCDRKCYGHGKIHPEYSITHDGRVALNKDAIHSGSSLQQTPSMLDRLTKQYQKLLLLFNPEHA